MDRPPEYVFIAGSQGTHEVTVAASKIDATVDEPLILFATRRRSGFVRVPYDTIAPTDPYWVRPPRGFEQDVVDNLRWVVTP